MEKEHMLYANVVLNIYAKEKHGYEVLDISFPEEYFNQNMEGAMELVIEELRNKNGIIEAIYKDLVNEYDEMRLYKIKIGFTFEDEEDFSTGEYDVKITYEYDVYETIFKDSDLSISEIPKEYYAVHVLSQDTDKISKEHFQAVSDVKSGKTDGDAILEEKVFKLIARANSENIFEIESLTTAFIVCGVIALEIGVKKIAIEETECSIGWENFKKEIRTIFANAQMEVMFCKR